jgi:hypothetical protein
VKPELWGPPLVKRGSTGEKWNVTGENLVVIINIIIIIRQIKTLQRVPKLECIVEPASLGPSVLLEQIVFHWRDFPEN